MSRLANLDVGSAPAPVSADVVRQRVSRATIANAQRRADPDAHKRPWQVPEVDLAEDDSPHDLDPDWHPTTNDVRGARQHEADAALPSCDEANAGDETSGRAAGTAEAAAAAAAAQFVDEAVAAATEECAPG
eukprot:6050957-Prymnesium_polylepis.1